MVWVQGFPTRTEQMSAGCKPDGGEPARKCRTFPKFRGRIREFRRGIQ